jgi:hypothetical protein
MRLQIYKPNSKNTGCAVNFNFSKSKGKLAFYLNSIKQFSWDAQKRTGSFSQNAKDPNKNISCKFSPTELGEMLACFENNIGWSTVHVFNDNKTVVSVNPWSRETKVGVGAKQTTYQSPWFGISVSKNGGEPFLCSFSPGEVAALRVLIQEFLKQFMIDADADYFNKGNQNDESEGETSNTQGPEESSDDELPDF